MSDDDRPGLLEQIADTALDDDYYVVQAGRPEPSRRFNTVLTGTVLAVFALMVTIAAVQTRTDRPATQREQRALAEDVSFRRSVGTERRDAVAALKAQVADLSAASAQGDPAMEELEARTAGVAVRGPGLRITITPAADDGGPGDVSDSDLQVLVNALWFVGAEAVSVNGQRIGTLTSIRTAGSAVTVNYSSIEPPYTVRAIGDISTLRDRLTDSRLGRDWVQRANDTGLEFDVSSTAEMKLPAVDEKRQRIRRAETAEEGSP